MFLNFSVNCFLRYSILHVFSTFDLHFLYKLTMKHSEPSQWNEVTLSKPKNSYSRSVYLEQERLILCFIMYLFISILSTQYWIILSKFIIVYSFFPGPVAYSLNRKLIRICFFLLRNRRSPTNSGKSDYINMDESPGEFNSTLIK